MLASKNSCRCCIIPLSRAFIASLPREKVTCAPDEEQQCPICLKNIEEGDRCGLDNFKVIAWHWPITISAWWPYLAAIRSMMPVWSLGCQRQRTVHCAGWTVEDSNFCSIIILCHTFLNSQGWDADWRPAMGGNEETEEAKGEERRRLGSLAQQHVWLIIYSFLW